MTDRGAHFHGCPIGLSDDDCGYPGCLNDEGVCLMPYPAEPDAISTRAAKTSSPPVWTTPGVAPAPGGAAGDEKAPPMTRHASGKSVRLRNWPWTEGVEWEPEPCDYCAATPRCVGNPQLCYGCLVQWAYIGPQYAGAIPNSVRCPCGDPLCVLINAIKDYTDWPDQRAIDAAYGIKEAMYE